MLNRITMSPPVRIAIVGGGQLGKMMTIAAKQMGFHVTVLDPTPSSPAGQVADRQIVASFADGGAIRQMASQADVVTYEFEHIDSDSLIALEESGQAVYPDPKVLRVIQNKLTQKQALVGAGISVTPFMLVSSRSDAEHAASIYGFPFLLKSCTGGYDGKGNVLVKNIDEINNAIEILGGCEMMAEKFVPFICEVSVMVARSIDGEIRSYPLSENEHKENILHRSIVPARVSNKVSGRARKAAEAVMSTFSGVGVFCVEMFVTPEEEILINEVAPRPHNSGHYTIEACVTSQFEQQIRAIVGLPLGDTSLVSPAVMINLLGEDGHHGPAVLDGCAEALALPGVHLHLYGKALTAPKRKMGHVTVTASVFEEAVTVASKAQKMLRVIS